jgi:hypothetical protein
MGKPLVIALTCDTCAHWSETCAQSIGCGPIEALCESPASPKSGRMTTETDSCPAHSGAMR